MITIVTAGDDRIIEQIMKQLNKVVEVLKVIDLTETDFLDRETALIKVHTKPEHRDEAIRIADIFRAKIVDSSPTTYTIEITCQRGVDVLADDLSRDKLKLDGLEMVGGDVAGCVGLLGAGEVDGVGEFGGRSVRSSGVAVERGRGDRRAVAERSAIV